MNTPRAILFGILALLMATTADAQQSDASGGATVASLGGQSVTVGPRLQHPTPLFFVVVSALAVEIWTRVPPPYDATANRTAADNPLP
ncbi:MAG TPA: hypothetical protein VIZ17_16105 [Acetobacteraceae bacterium]